MTHQLDISDTELRLILELIEREHKELLMETRHTDARAYRSGLRERLVELETLQQRLQGEQKKITGAGR